VQTLPKVEEQHSEEEQPAVMKFRVGTYTNSDTAKTDDLELTCKCFVARPNKSITITIPIPCQELFSSVLLS